jgi:hypothetical protein
MDSRKTLTMDHLNLPTSLRDAQIAYELFSGSPLLFGWVAGWQRDLTESERAWLEGNGFVRVVARWYKRDD